MNDLNKKFQYVKNILQAEDVFSLLDYLGAEPRYFNKDIMAKTICHGGEKKKLYYYNNSKLFHCYTQCGCSMDIFELITKVKRYCSLYESFVFLVDYFKIDIPTLKQHNKIQDWNYFEKIHKQKQLRQLNIQTKTDNQVYNKKVLDNFNLPVIKFWEEEGITSSALRTHNIRYNSLNNGILIPHYDIDNNFIGLRERSLNPEDIITYGKYHPVKLNGVIYKHPLSNHLYNLNNVKENILRTHSACLFESEKSCLQFESFYGKDKDISVAVCGSNISHAQIQLLKKLGIKELIISFDKEFKELNDEYFKKYIIKLKNIGRAFHNDFKVSFVFDKWGKLNYKDSPTDKGKEIFTFLFSNREYF